MATDAPLADELADILAAVIDPELRRPLGEVGMLRGATVAGRRGAAVVVLPAADHPTGALDARIDEAVAAVSGIDGVDVTYEAMTDDEQRALRIQLIGEPETTGGTHEGHGHAEGRAVRFADPGSATRVLLVASGKGGVGKSSVTTNLSIALAQRDRRVAVVDADVWGFSIPRMIGVDRAPTVIDQMIVPPEANGVRVISMGFFAREDQPVIWRGPMLHKALEQFLTDVFWDEPDYLVIDLPPGTGDISLSLAQFVPRGEVLVVTTPQPAAQKVAQRAAYMAQKVNLDVRGVIENMSWFRGDDGVRYELFGAGGGSALAADLDVPLLGQVPLVPALREGGDTGRPIVVADPSNEASEVFVQMACRLDEELLPTKRYHPGLKLL